jgi:hypothetical protein
MVARDVRDDHLLGRRDAEQLGVNDEMVRVLVMPVVVDVIADVVQQRGVGERGALLGDTSEPRADRVEEAQREAADVECVPLLEVAALGELAHRPLAGRTRIGDDGRHARQLEQQSLADAVPRHGEITRLDARHHLRRHGEAGDDDVGPLGVEAGDGAALLGGHRRQGIEDVLDVHARHHRLVHVAGGEHAVPRKVDRREVGERPARPDHLRSAPVAACDDLLQASPHFAAQAAQRLRRGPVIEKALREPKRAEGEGDEVIEHAVGGERELERPPADVHHHGAADAEVEVGERAEVREPRLVLPVDDTDRETGLLADARDELLRVPRVAHRARRHGLDPRGTELPGEGGHARDGLGGALHRLGAEETRAFEIGAEPRRLLHLVHDGDRTVRRDVRNDLADGVGADVDRGDAARLGGGGQGA